MYFHLSNAIVENVGRYKSVMYVVQCTRVTKDECTRIIIKTAQLFQKSMK